MQYKLNKTIREAIIKAALRSKHQEALDALEQEMQDVYYTASREECKHDYIESLNLESFITDLMPTYSYVSIGSRPYQLSFQNADAYLNAANVNYRVYYGSNRTVYANDSVNLIDIEKYDYVKKFHKKCRAFVKKVEEDLSTISAAVHTYNSAKKMFAELPWTQDFYPEEHKPVGGALVPIESIAKANELFGVK